MTSASWFALAGALLGGVGSAMRAWFALKEYQDLIQQAKIPELLKAQIRFYRSWMGFRWMTQVAGVPCLVAAWGFLRLLSLIWKDREKPAEWATKAKGLLKTKVEQNPVVALFQAQLAVVENLALIRKSGQDEARKLGELANEVFAWSLILLGAVAVAVASAIRIAVA